VLLMPLGNGWMLPSNCVRCGSSESHAKELKYQHRPNWCWIGILGGLLPFIILAAVFSKRASATYFSCRRCSSYRGVKQLAAFSVFPLAIVGLMWVDLTFGPLPSVGVNAVWLLLLGALIAAMVLVSRAELLGKKKSNEQFVSFARCHEAVLAQLPSV
jgi:hypothetical protein